jgi:hypothetical protein
MKRSARYHAGHMFYAATSLGLDDVTKACVKAEAEIRLFVLLLYMASIYLHMPTGFWMTGTVVRTAFQSDPSVASIAATVQPITS